MFLSNIKQFLNKNKNIIWFIGLFLIVFGLTFDTTFALDNTEATEEFIKKISAFAEFFLKGISVILALITYLATVFLSPEWINGSLFGLNTHFKAVWILVSNVVYFAFAFILIWIAFMNIIGKSGDQYQLKQALPKFIVGVLIVPFSWFLVQFILSISAILTVSALSLPFDTFKDFEGGIGDVQIPKECTVDLMKISERSFIDCPKENTEKLTKVIESGDAIKSIYGIISMYTYGVLSFDTVGSVDKESFANIETLGDLAVKLVFDFLFVVIYSILMIALGLVLMIRGIYIWIYTMISPVFGLMYFFDKKEGGEGFFGKFNVKEFIALAMVPVYTMLALSFGLLFMYVVGSGLTGSSLGTGSVEIIDSKGKEDAKIKILDFTLIIKGAAAKQENVTGMLTSIGGGALGVVGSLILKIFGIVILWGTVMAAMRSSEITKTITQPLHDFGGKVGSIVASGPANLPLFGGQSMKSMGNLANAADSHITTMTNKRSQSLLDKHGLFGAGKESAGFRNLEGEIKKANGVKPNHVDLLHKIFKAADGDTKKLYTDPEAQKRLFELAKEMKIKMPDNIKAPSSISSTDRLEELINAMEAKDPDAYRNIIKGAAHGQIKINHIIDQVKIDKTHSTTDSPSGGNDNNQPKIKHLDTKTIININGNDKVVSEYKDGQVSKLGSTTADDLAEYINTNRLDKTSIDKLFRDLELSDNAKKELNDFFWEKDGKIIFARNKKDGDNGYKKSTLDNYIGQNS